MSADMELYRAAGRITCPAMREEIAARRAAVERISEAGRGNTVDAIRAEADGLGIAFQTMRTMYYNWRKKGDEALIDGRKVPRAGGANMWAEVYKRYVENDRNTSKNGWKVMMRDFRLGTVDGSVATYADVFRGIGTWREVWQAEFPNRKLPDGYPSGWLPKGATYQNLQRLCRFDPDHLFHLAANRQGRQAAHKFLLDVLKSRRGVPVGAIRQWDDVWHNFDVRLPNSDKSAQPLEFAGYDVASAYKCDSIMKPRFTRLDGKRDNLKEQTFRFAVGHAHCVTGFHKDGTTNIVELGTAAIREPIRKQIALIPHYGNLIKFENSGILSEQVHAGLFIGSGGGNFRFKPLVECSHSLLANATAHLPGNRGRDAAHMHESRNALVRYDESLIKAAKQLPAATAAMIQYGLMTFDEYTEAYRLVEREFMRNYEHRLEGWDSNMIQEYSTAANPTEADWHNARELLDMPPEEGRAIAAFLANHRSNVRTRFMSRYEVWMAGQADLIRVPLMEMPAFLDDRDMLELTVRDNGTIDFSNGYFYGRDKMIYRVDTIETPGGWSNRLITPRQKVFVKYNPFTPDQVWIINKDNGSTVGMAAIHSRAPMMDKVEIERAMGVQSHDLARKIRPVRGRHQDAAVKRAGQMGRNQSALLGLATHLPLDNTTVSADPQKDDSDDVPDAMDVAAAAFDYAMN